MERIQAVRGMNDILPGEIGWWQQVEEAARRIFQDFGYVEIRTPVLEKLELFTRSIGENTDIVEKEMYAFPDRKGEWLALRPEATASIVRSFIQNDLYADPLARKFYSMGPMFRHERPQKGRYRQFHQVDVEAFGIDDPMLDAEIMFMLRLFLQKVGLAGVGLHINSLGCRDCRKSYRESLRVFLASQAEGLCPDCLRRREVNPLRVLDCKVERCKTVLETAPVLLETLCDPCRDHFSRVQDYLSRLDTPFAVDPRMVRGLDYYMRTTFEVVTDRLGAQSAVGGGGRYNGLIRDLGGPDLPGIGFAVGMERLVLLLQQQSGMPRKNARFFVATLGSAAREEGFLLVQRLRSAGIGAELDYEGRSLKSQMRRADKLGARFVFILGEDELGRGEIQLRDMREKNQRIVPLGEAVRHARTLPTG